MNQLNSNIKDQFVSSLMNYFKIEEDINLRAHIADVTQHIESAQYREFFRRLSFNDYAYKGAFEKIALVVKSFEDEQRNILFSGVKERVKALYDTMYELRRMMVLEEGQDLSPLERFVRIHFARLKRAQTQELLLDELDIDVVKSVGKEWIFNHVAYDKSLFLDRIELEYKNVLLRRHNEDKPPSLSREYATRMLNSTAE